MAFSDLMRLNICIYTSLDQQEPEIEINHPHNSGTICIFLRNWKYYEGLEKYNNEEINYLIILAILKQNKKKMIY